MCDQRISLDRFGLPSLGFTIILNHSRFSSIPIENQRDFHWCFSESRVIDRTCTIILVKSHFVSKSSKIVRQRTRFIILIASRSEVRTQKRKKENTTEKSCRWVICLLHAVYLILLYGGIHITRKLTRQCACEDGQNAYSQYCHGSVIHC